jgi:hypothetical protein
VRFLGGVATAAACFVASLAILGLDADEREVVVALRARFRALLARRS